MKKELKKRRAYFMSMIGDNRIAVIPNNQRHTRNGDVRFPFRSNSDFYYITGFDEPNAVAVLLSESKGDGKYVLFCEEKDPAKELWEGDIIGIDRAVSEYEADDAFPIEDMYEILPNLLENRESLVYNMGSHETLDNNLIAWINQIKEQSRTDVQAPKEIVSPDYVLHEMRLFKSRGEIGKIKKAIKATGRGHICAMKKCKPGMLEYELEAELAYEFIKTGSKMPAYPSIVASGINACTLHYTDNNQKLESGNLVLIDAGAEYECYASDITRTFPINGKFSVPQREVYEIVLEAQKAAIAISHPGTSWEEIHSAAVRVIAEGLLKLGILSDTLENIIDNETYKKYFMHRTGHWLGMDVHDVGEYKVLGKWRELEPGMVFTIEPGIYISENSEAPRRYHGIGIRIEDNILVTKNGAEVLSRRIPKTINEIENLMAT